MSKIIALFIETSLDLMGKNPRIYIEYGLSSMITSYLLTLEKAPRAKGPETEDARLSRPYLHLTHPHAGEEEALISFKAYAAFLSQQIPNQVSFHVSDGSQPRPSTELEAIFFSLWRIQYALNDEFKARITAFQLFVQAMVLATGTGPVRQDAPLKTGDYWALANTEINKLAHLPPPPNIMEWKTLLWEIIRSIGIMQIPPAEVEAIPPLYQPIHTAACRGKVDALRQLISEGSKPDTPAEAGLTPLHLAAARGKLNICEALIQEYQLDPNQASELGYTPLHLAAKNGHYSVATYLLSCPSVNPVHKTKAGDTPLDLLKQEFIIEAETTRAVSFVKRTRQVNERVELALFLIKRSQNLTENQEDNGDSGVVNSLTKLTK
jgi:hypothetical protein